LRKKIDFGNSQAKVQIKKLQNLQNQQLTMNNINIQIEKKQIKFLQGQTNQRFFTIIPASLQCPEFNFHQVSRVKKTTQK